MDNVYFATIKWYSDYKDEDKVSNVFILASSYGNAVEKAAFDFDDIDSIYVEQLTFGASDSVDVNCIYVPNDAKIIEVMKNENTY